MDFDLIIMMMFTLKTDADDDYTFKIISKAKNKIGNCFAKSLRDAIWGYESGDILILANILIQTHSR